MASTYCFDIDGTLCSLENGNYARSLPMQERILHVNSLHDAGHTIKLFTARGATTGFDWSDFTRQQVESWGLQCHTLLMGKPHADFFVDDKATSAADYPWGS